MKNKSTIVRSIQSVAPALSRLAPPLAARVLEQLALRPIRHRTPQREREWLKGATTRRIAVDAQTEVPIFSWGEGPVVLLVHGWSGRGSQLAAIKEPLLARGYRVVCVDTPGNGRAGGRYSAIPVIAQTVQRVAEDLGPIHAIYAHSHGTAGTTVALSRGLDVQRVVYISPPNHPQLFLQQAAELLRFSPQVAERAQDRIERRFNSTFDEQRGSNVAPRLTTPLLVIHDLKDRDVPHTHGEELVRAWPGARLMSTEGQGHTRILRAESVLNAAVDFISANGTLEDSVEATGDTATREQVEVSGRRTHSPKGSATPPQKQRRS